MSKVIPLFQKSESVADALKEAGDREFTEIMILAKNPDGTFWFRTSPMECAYRQMGVLHAGISWLQEVINENNF
jgi:hypothetical protein